MPGLTIRHPGTDTKLLIVNIVSQRRLRPSVFSEPEIEIYFFFGEIRILNRLVKYEIHRMIFFFGFERVYIL